MTSEPKASEKGKKVDRLSALIAGTIAPMNEVISYFILKIKECRKEEEALVIQGQKLQQELLRITDRLKEVRAESKKYIQDIEEWDNEEK